MLDHVKGLSDGELKELFIADKKVIKDGSLPSRKALPPFGALRAFDAVARLGGVRKAALGLERDHAVISRHIRSLEAWTGAVLVERTPKGIILTDEGILYHKQIAGAIDQIADATTDLMKKNESLPLQIWCMPAFALHWLNGKLGEFEASNSGTDIEVRPTDTSPNFRTHEADIDIRFIPRYGSDYQLPQGLRSIEIARPKIIALASPEFLADKPEIKHPRDLLKYSLLHEEDFEPWRQWLIAHNVDVKDELTGPLLWQGHLTLDAARHGRGIAISNHLVIVDDISSGKLVEIGVGNPNFANETTGSYYAIARADRWQHPSIRRFIKWIKAEVVKTTST